MGMVGNVVAVIVIVVDGRYALIWMISQNLLYNDLFIAAHITSWLAREE